MSKKGSKKVSKKCQKRSKKGVQKEYTKRIPKKTPISTPIKTPISTFYASKTPYFDKPVLAGNGKRVKLWNTSRHGRESPRVRKRSKIICLPTVCRERLPGTEGARQHAH